MKKIFLILVILGTGYIFGIKNVAKDIAKDFILVPLRNFNLNSKVVRCPLDSYQIAYFGQSNSTNFVKPKASIPLGSNIFQYDWQSRKCYKYKEPLIGLQNDSLFGNVMTYTANYISDKSAKPIIIIPFGKAGTSVLDWAYLKSSIHHNSVLEKIKSDNLYPDIFLWHQGENDSIYSLNYNLYKDALQVVLDRTNQYFPKSYFGIALVSICRENKWEPVREAQKEIIKLNKNAFLSADSDIFYGNEYRYDNCHFNSKGAKKLGKEYYESIKVFFN